jgi:hypothetical protein
MLISKTRLWVTSIRIADGSRLKAGNTLGGVLDSTSMLISKTRLWGDLSMDYR